MLAYEPVVLCNPNAELLIAPLPAKKRFWEAHDELEWKTEIQKLRGPEIAFALATNGDLLELVEGYVYCGNNISLNARPLSTGTENWQEWCSGMDGLGGLVMLAASLIA